MNFEIFYESITGYKNKAKNKESQDFFKYKKLDKGIICSIGDGHGINRCMYSQKGSELACSAFMNVIEDLYENIKNDSEEIQVNRVKSMIENKSIQRKIQDTWRDYVKNHFIKHIPNVYNIDYILYGTTLIGVLITNKIKLYMQIGDGNILEVSKDIEIIEYNKKNKVRGILNSMYLDDAYLYIDIKFDTLENEDLKSVVLFSDGFTNSFRNFDNLSDSISKTVEVYKKSVFSRYNLKKQYKNYLEYLTLNKSKDDITIAFIF